MNSLKRSHEKLSPKKCSPSKFKFNQESNYSPSKKLKKDIFGMQTSPSKFQMGVDKSTLTKDEDEDYTKWFDDEDDDFNVAVESCDVNDENLPSNSQNSNDIKDTFSQYDSILLNDWCRCVVEQVERNKQNFDLILHLKEEHSQKQAICRLKGPWCQTKVQENDLVSVKAVWDPTNNCFTVNSNDGLIIVNPDFLISGTSVVGSLFCTRKGVLQDKFSGLDAENKIMVVGSIIHELLQEVLVNKLTSAEQIEEVVQKLLKAEDMIFTLYASKISVEEIRYEVDRFLPNIVTFVEQYIKNEGSIAFTTDIFQGSIDKIQDIEENLWVPQLGLKGKIDVSVIARKQKHYSTFEQKYMPLELKTGRASFSAEHKGQLILYQIMLREIGKDVDSGLLLYLKDGIMKEISSTRNEQRDLIMRRNELAYYLTRNMKPNGREVSDNTTGAEFEIFELPEPINHANACSKCPYQTICCTFLKSDHKLQLSTKHPLVKISQDCTRHLNDADLQYFIRWCGLLFLEDQEIKKSSHNVRSLWCETPEERLNQGRALINLKILGNVEYNEQCYLHTFEIDEKFENRSQDFTLSGINPGDYVTISSRNRIAIAAGNVFDLTKHQIIVSLERNLLQNYEKECFIVDKLDSQSFNKFNYTNLSCLLDNTDEINHLRKIIVTKMKPTFKSSLPKVILTEGMQILKELNAVQRKATMKALAANDYMLIKGLPGTGKTQTITAIIRLLHLMNKSVLITSHTHSAVDNVLMRLKRNCNIPFLRLGSGAKISSQILENSEAHLTKSCKTVKDLENVYNSFSVVGVTCLGMSHAIFLHRKFDVCIIDEATQVFQPTVLRPLFYAEKFILVGDPEQLPPVIRSKEAKQMKAEETLFSRLDSDIATAILTLQYRMNKNIVKLANDLTYNGNLICANDTVARTFLQIPNKAEIQKTYSKEKWLLRALETHVDQAVVFIDTQNCFDRHFQFSESKRGSKVKLIEQRFSETHNKLVASPKQKKYPKFNYTNYCEGAVIFYLIKALIKTGYCKAENIGIIASYRAQVELLKKISEQFQDYYKNHNNDRIDFKNLEVNTVDQYQGRDKEVIFYSCTRTTSSSTSDIQQLALERKKDAEILEDRRRLTVAITRAKHKLIIVGDENCLKNCYTPFKDILTKIPSRCKIILEETKYGFSWDQIMEDLKKIMEN